MQTLAQQTDGFIAAINAECNTWHTLVAWRSAQTWQAWQEAAMALAVCRAAHATEATKEYANILEERLTNALFTD